MKTTVHFSAPKLPEGRFLVELSPYRDGTFDGVVISTGEAVDKWINSHAALKMMNDAGISMSRKSLMRLNYTGELRTCRPLPARVLFSSNSIRSYLARVKSDEEFWGEKKLVRKSKSAVKPSPKAP